ncbi:hypothetical protein CYMTET_25231 [Cymbomonas tetramitiformis]|uniref:Uncharacterized protein n=1 Tax=Cymbomonas tetramitiformis TaxID=36881 RepID=A0AAE0FUL9_9CHLO|nr:hypothetical protein CYMTET_25231 [Cymbomonas tetramitiformis]
MSGTESEVTAPPQPAPAVIKTLSQKFEHAKQLEGEVQRRIQDWVNALGKETVTSLIFKHFKAKALETHGKDFNLQHCFGNISTNSSATSYIAHIVKYLPRLCTITGEGASEDVSISEPSVNLLAALEVGELEALQKSRGTEHNAEQRTAQSVPPGFDPASPSISLVDLELGEDRNEEEEWEDTEDRGGYGSANLTGIYQSTLVEHEESGDFDPTAILRAQNYVAEIGNRTEEVAGHEGDLSNEDFIQTVKITRMIQGDRSNFSDREIGEATRQITQLLERLCLDISHLSVKGLDRPEKETADNKDPFILVRVKSESEARAILVKAVFVIDDRRYVASPKSNRLVRFNVSFVAAAANLQVSTDRIVQFLNGTVLSEFVSRIVYVQSFSEDIRGISGTGSRGAGSAPWEQNQARAAKRKSEPTSQSPAYKHASGIERREEIATAARRGGADISDRY